MDKEESMKILEKFFGECVRYWERELKVESDISKEPYIRALAELPKTNPYKAFNPEPLDKDAIERFKRYRLMDIYGRDWERYLYDKSRICKV